MPLYLWAFFYYQTKEKTEKWKNNLQKKKLKLFKFEKLNFGGLREIQQRSCTEKEFNFFRKYFFKLWITNKKKINLIFFSSEKVFDVVCVCCWLINYL